MDPTTEGWLSPGRPDRAPGPLLAEPTGAPRGPLRNRKGNATPPSAPKAPRHEGRPPSTRTTRNRQANTQTKHPPNAKQQVRKRPPHLYLKPRAPGELPRSRAPSKPPKTASAADVPRGFPVAVHATPKVNPWQSRNTSIAVSMPDHVLAARTSTFAHGRHPRPPGRSPHGFPNWDAVTGVFRNDEGFTRNSIRSIPGNRATHLSPSASRTMRSRRVRAASRTVATRALLAGRRKASRTGML